MKKRFLKGVIVLLALISISIIAVVSFSSRLDATLHNGQWVYQKNVIIGCAGSGGDCVWGTVDPDPDPN